MDPWRLADPVLAVSIRAVASRDQTQHVADHQPVEDSRQSQTKPRIAHVAGAPGGRLDVLPGRSGYLDDCRPDRADVPAAANSCIARHRTATRAVDSRVLPQSGTRRGHRARTGGTEPHVPRLSRIR